MSIQKENNKQSTMVFSQNMKKELFLSCEQISRNIDKLKYVLIFFTFKITFQEYLCHLNYIKL